MSELAGRVVLVTGAAGNVGRAVVQRLLAENAQVAGMYRQAGAHPAALALTGDLTDEAAVEAAFTRTEQALGPLWGVLHIAGAWRGGQRIADTELALFDEMLSTNLRSSFLVARSAHRRMRGRGGRIVLVGSHTAATNTGLSGSAAYNVSKAGVIMLAKAMAEEGDAEGVFTNCVAPGTIATEANRNAMPNADASRWVSAEEVAETIISAASPTSVLNGAVLTVRGRG